MVRSTLFPLAFGNRKSAVVECFKSYAEIATKAVPTLAALDPLTDAGHAFQARLCAVQIGSVEGLAYASTPMRFADPSPERCYIDIGFAGQQGGIIGKRKLHWGNRRDIAFLVPGEHIEAVAGLNSSVMFKVDQTVLQKTIRCMFPEEETKLDLGILSRSSVINGVGGLINHINNFESICKIIDDCDGDADILARLPIDDMIYRAFLLAIFGDNTEFVRNKSRKGANKLDLICDNIIINTDRWLSSTEMEALAGISFRAISSAFHRRFGVSPMSWQRAEKLRYARKLILEDETVKIGELSKRLGFPSPSAFSSFYREQFGELPRATKKSTR